MFIGRLALNGYNREKIDCSISFNWLALLIWLLDSMILLGSIQRPQLQSLLNLHMQKLYQSSSNAESEDALCARPETPDPPQLQSEYVLKS